MKITRTKELENLKQFYEKAGSQLMVLYGSNLIGKTSLLKEFVKDKPYIYYAARSVSDEEQKKRLADELGLLKEREAYFSYMDIFLAVENQNMSAKKVIIFDEFHRMIKQSPELFEDIISYMQQRKSQNVLFILCSSSIAFVENQLVKKIGRNALAIQSFYKVKELEFCDVCKFFPDYSLQDCMKVYSITGGVPGLLSCFDEKLSVEENIKQNVLREGAFLRDEGERWIASELRETAVYYTIMSKMAEGHLKLNELYEETGFSRAKISVYLKNLMELEIVDKIFSVDTKGWDNTQKGIYQIKNHYLQFYFAYLWKNLSALQILSEDGFYDMYMEPSFEEYSMNYFPKVCVSVVEQMNQKGKLPFVYTRSGKWVGKNGTIDLLAMDEEDNRLTCFCHHSNKVMTYEDYEWALFLLKQAKVDSDYIYLFSINGFEEKLKEEAAKNDKLLLWDEKSLWENL